MAVIATGGTETIDGLYKVHTFTSSGVFNVETAGDVEVLVVAGGGGGGSSAGGGGGAGGLVYNSALAVTAQAYSVTVGDGGQGAQVTNTQGSKGSNSVFSSITADGGGGGASIAQGSNRNGGSGGGGASYGSFTAGGTATSGQGNNGGSAEAGSTASGGGGGAGAAGQSGSGSTAGGGGVGVAYSISGASVYYAGGGGSGGDNSTTGGNGGGGAGATGDSVGTNGTANTGGGGGGARNASSTDAAKGGNGGSGVVIVRYLNSSGANFEKHIPLSYGTSNEIGTISTTSATYVETTNPTYAYMATADYASATYYFEAVIKTSAGTAYAQLYDDAGNAISGTEVSTASTTRVRVRSAAFTPGATGTYTVRIKNNGTNTTTYYKASIVIIQNGSSITATETQVSLVGQLQTTASASYVNLSTIYWNWFRYTSANWDGTMAIYLEATLKTTGGTATVALHNSSDTLVTSSECATTSASYVRVRSSAISLTNATDYKVMFKTTAGTVSIADARIIIQQTGTITKTEAYIPLLKTTSGNSASGSTQVDLNMPTDYTSTNWNGSTIAWYHEISAYCTGVGTFELYKETDAARLTGSDVTSSNNSVMTRYRSAALSMPASQSITPRTASGSGTFYITSVHIIAVITWVSGSPSSSVSLSPSVSPSASASISVSASPSASQSPSSSVSASISLSPSVSESASPSASQSPSSSESASISLSPSSSLSPSVPPGSPSPSLSPSVSPSVSASSSLSASPSASQSPSSSVSASPSPSPEPNTLSTDYWKVSFKNAYGDKYTVRSEYYEEKYNKYPSRKGTQ